MFNYNPKLNAAKSQANLNVFTLDFFLSTRGAIKGPILHAPGAPGQEEGLSRQMPTDQITSGGA